MEIERGMYVRTDEGFIGKLLDIRQRPSGAVHASTGIPVIEYIFDSPMWDSSCTDGYYDDCILDDLEMEEITKEPSYEIIKLLKPGDLVTLTGKYCIDEIYRVINVYDDIAVVDCFMDGSMNINGNSIKSVLTKEQFEHWMYEVKHENN